jgi:putative secretion ATPase (PEP-CTERM system associated)
MYLEHHQLREFPFQLTPDSDFLYPSKIHSRAKAYMDYAIWNRDGFVVITGEVGAGKTTIIQKFLSELDQNVVVAKIFQTQLNEIEFLQAVSSELGIRPSSTNKVDIINTLNTFLLECYAQSKQFVLIVDEAQNLTYSVLEEIRMLSGLETHKEKLLHIILVGQPELKEKIESPELSQLLQRVRLRFHLRGLSEVETREYILHRLRVAGARRLSIFADNTIPIIYQYTGGIPRLINTLCDTALTCAYADELRTVTTAVVKVAIDELQWLPFSRRTKAASLKRWVGQADNPELTRLIRENRQLLSEIGKRLEKLESLFPLTGKVSAIEAQLRRIADTIERHDSNDNFTYSNTTRR